VTALAIEVRGLVKRFDDVVAVAGIDLSIPQGQCVGLLGPNGAGKTTTVEILEGLQTPTEGKVEVLGRTWSTDAESIRARIGLALQETHFEGRLTVKETIRVFRSFYRHGLSVEQAIAHVQLEEKQNTYVNNLSGGQRQRLALAVALVGDPELLFLDEPTTGLDPQSRRALWDVIEGYKQRGKTVVLTTHYMEEAERLCDHVVIVDRGRVVAQGTPPQLIGSIGAEQVVEFSAAPPLSVETLSRIPGVRTVNERNGRVQLSVSGLHIAVPALMSAVEHQGSALLHLSTRQGTLDDVFLALTGRSLREEGS